MTETTKKFHTNGRPKIIIPKKTPKYTPQNLSVPKHIQKGNGLAKSQTPTSDPKIIVPDIIEPDYWHNVDFGGQQARSRTYTYQLYSEYHQAINYSGGNPQTMTWESFKDEVEMHGIGEIHGIVIPGGADIHPKHYNCKKHQLCGAGDGERDEIELEFTKFALEHNIPLLGVCRGHQMLNVATGGTLHQDLSLAKKNPMSHQASNHFVLSESKGMFADIVQARGFEVNSYHHQCIKKLGEGLKICAMAPDGIIEAVYASELKFALGVQFHPEYLENKYAERIFEAFITAAEDTMYERSEFA